MMPGGIQVQRAGKFIVFRANIGNEKAVISPPEQERQ